MISQTKQEAHISTFKSQATLVAEICLVPSQFQLGIRVAGLFAESGQGAAIQAPAIFTLSQWVSDCAMRVDLLSGAATPRSPDHFELLQLWDATIGESLPEVTAQERYALAQRAYATSRLMSQWVLDSGSSRERGSRGRFWAWREAVYAVMQRLHWHDSENWMLRLIGHLEGSELPGGILPKVIILAGFIELTALEVKLVATLRHRGITVTVEKAPAPDCVTPTRQCFESIEQELSAAASWAQQELEKGRRRIAVIVNGLESLVDQVRTIFENQLQPEAVLALQDPADAPFHISTGPPLANIPLVSDALMLLEMAVAGTRTTHEFPRISRLLRSPNWAGGSEERVARANLELALRKTGYYRWSLVQVAELAARSPQAKSLKQLITRLNGLGVGDKARHPALQLLNWLIEWGWPGDNPCSGVSARDQARLLAILESLSRQSFSDTEACLLRLKRSCGQELTPGPGGAFSPVQVITPGEAYGLEFDAAWAMNFTMENWPGRPVSSPFLHTDLLKQIPRATEDGVLDYAERLTGALRACAPEVRFSWCNRLDDLPVSVSPLIGDLPQAVTDAVPVPRSTLWRALAPDAALISGYKEHPWLTPSAPGQGRAIEAKLDTGTDQHLRSAVTLLNYQSACPLAAYLVFRLDARMPPIPLPFSTAAWRGELVHAALERLYGAYRGSQQRPSFQDVAPAVVAALAHCCAERRLSPSELNAVRQHLEELLTAWLDFEQQWTGGDIESLEWRKTMEFQGLRIDVRIDRVDRTADGRVFLLDYKTGASGRLPAWADERPGDLQLPLYAVLMAQADGLEPAGIAIATVHMNGMKFIGLTADSACVTHGISGFDKPAGRLAKQFNSWEQALEQWRVKLAELLVEVRAGDCRHLLFRPETLKYADLDILLRSEEGKRWNLETEDHGSG